MKNWKNIDVGHTPSTSGIDSAFVKSICKKESVLEIGCGSGRIIDMCKNISNDILGIDINENEIKNLKFRFKNRKNISMLALDMCKSKIQLPRKFDKVFLNGFLGAVSKNDRAVVLENIKQNLCAGGTVHLSEFLLFEESKIMKKRYVEDYKKTKEYGTFFVKDKDGNKICQTHNFLENELIHLISFANLKIIKTVKEDFVSYTGNIKPGIIFILK